MRNAICCLVFLFGSWPSIFAQNAPKLTTPRIVATFERLGLTAELPPTTIYTPKTWGTFRISIVMVGTLANGTNASWIGAIRFTDGSGPNGPDGFGAGLYTVSRETAVSAFPIRAKAGKPLKFSVTSSGDTSGSKYNVWVVVEQLM